MRYLLLLTLILLAGCARPAIYTPFTTQINTPTIEKEIVLTTQDSERNYTELGVIVIVGRIRDNLPSRFRKKAAEVGADAVIKMTYNTNPYSVSQGVAIKYND